MADRPKLPKSIVVLNIIMAVVLLAICALAVALFVQAKDPRLEPSHSGQLSGILCRFKR